MSSVKVNSNTYADISSVRLPLSDGSGYAVYTEGQSQNENAVFDALMAGDNLGDYTNSEITKFNPVVLSYRTLGTWNLPNVATVMGGNIQNFTAANLLMPGALGCSNPYPQFRGGKVTGVMDFRSYNGNSGLGNASLSFFVYGMTIGTLRLDALNLVGGSMFGTATITNLVWGGANLTADGIKAVLNAAASITNLYITDAIYDDVAALISAGTITKVTNLYKYSEWSDD